MYFYFKLFKQIISVESIDSTEKPYFDFYIKNNNIKKNSSLQSRKVNSMLQLRILFIYFITLYYIVSTTIKGKKEKK